VLSRGRDLWLWRTSPTPGDGQPGEELAAMAHSRGVPVLGRRASGAHLKVDVQSLGGDFYAFSGHKTYGRRASAHCMGSRHSWRRCRHIQGAGT